MQLTVATRRANSNRLLETVDVPKPFRVEILGTEPQENCEFTAVSRTTGSSSKIRLIVRAASNAVDAEVGRPFSATIGIGQPMVRYRTLEGLLKPFGQPGPRSLAQWQWSITSPTTAQTRRKARTKVTWTAARDMGNLIKRPGG